MTRRALSTERAPKAIGPYSQGIQLTGAGLVFCSGQVGLDPETQQMVAGGVEVEARRALENLRGVLAAAGLTMDDIVRTTIYLTDMAHFQAVNAIYAGFFSGEPPARTTIAVVGLPKNALVEIDAIAARTG